MLEVQTFSLNVSRNINGRRVACISPFIKRNEEKEEDLQSSHHTINTQLLRAQEEIAMLQERLKNLDNIKAELNEAKSTIDVLQKKSAIAVDK